MTKAEDQAIIKKASMPELSSDRQHLKRMIHNIQDELRFFAKSLIRGGRHGRQRSVKMGQLCHTFWFCAVFDARNIVALVNCLNADTFT